MRRRPGLPRPIRSRGRTRGGEIAAPRGQQRSRCDSPALGLAPDQRRISNSGCGPGIAVHWPPMARVLRVPLTLEDRAGVAVTYDDGPHPEGTPEVLELLACAGAKATARRGESNSA